MFTEYFRAGGPVMYVVFGAWVVVLAAVFDRVAYATGRAWRVISTSRFRNRLLLKLTFRDARA